MSRLAVLGGTKMGEALLAGLLASRWLAASEVTMTARSEERLEHLRRTTSFIEAGILLGLSREISTIQAPLYRSRELARGEPEA